MSNKRVFVVVAALAALLSVALPVHAQPTPLDRRWSVDVGLGWDNGISGNINSGGTGKINDQNVVILPNSYDQVYGTGFQFRFGGGYMIDEVTEVRGMFTYQSLGADLTPMGDIGTSKLYGQYDPYKTFALDGAFRRYVDLGTNLRGYGEGTLGIGFISRIELALSAPSINMTAKTTDMYDRTAAMSLGGNVGVLWQTTERVGVYAQIGLRWMSGLSAIDGLAGTNLETINDNSSRWTMPFIVGVRAKF